MTGVGSRHRPRRDWEARSRLRQHSCSFDHLISASDERGRDRRAENAHSITSFACARIVGETFDPKLACSLRLITISKVVRS